MNKRKILIATSNKGKFDEIKHFLSDLPFEFLSLNDLPKKITAPDEIELTLDGNAVLKAKYYAEKTKLLSLSDDGGLFIDALNGWPGVASARIAETDSARRALVLSRMHDVKKRSAEFQAALALYDPACGELHLTNGKSKGEILTKAVTKTKNGFWCDPIFYVIEMKKTFAEMSTVEKNGCSHRGKALQAMKIYLQKISTPRHIVVPAGVLLHDGKIQISKRNDPHNPKLHGCWELNGGSMEWGEDIIPNLKREMLEETGCVVEPIKQLGDVQVVHFDGKEFRYQVYLIYYICRIIKDTKKINDHEVMELKWIDPNVKELEKYKFMPSDGLFLEKHLSDIKQAIKDYNL